MLNSYAWNYDYQDGFLTLIPHREKERLGKICVQNNTPWFCLPNVYKCYFSHIIIIINISLLKQIVEGDNSNCVKKLIRNGTIDQRKVGKGESSSGWLITCLSKVILETYEGVGMSLSIPFHCWPYNIYIFYDYWFIVVWKKEGVELKI